MELVAPAQFVILLGRNGVLTLQFGNPADINIPIEGDSNGGGIALTPNFGMSGAVNIPRAGDSGGNGNAEFAIHDETKSEFFILRNGEAR